MARVKTSDTSYGEEQADKVVILVSLGQGSYNIRTTVSH